jgi:hypothetical protein
MRVDWWIGWLAAALKKGGGWTANRGRSAPWIARRLRTNYFKMHSKLSELMAARQPYNLEEYIVESCAGLRG